MSFFYSTVLLIALLVILLRSPFMCILIVIIIYISGAEAATPDTYRLIAKDIQRIIILVEPRGEELPTEYIDVLPTTQPEEPCVIDLLQEDSCK